MRNKRPTLRNIGIDLDSRVLKHFEKYPHNFTFFHGRAEDFLAAFDFRGGEAIYCDPPYLPSARRKGNIYKFEYNESAHEALLKILIGLPCSIIISGYPSSLYNNILSEWLRIDFSGTSQIGSRKECLWLNYTPQRFHDLRYLGWDFRERQSVKRKRNRWVAKFLKEELPVQQALFEDISAAYLNTLQTKQRLSPYSK